MFGKHKRVRLLIPSRVPNIGILSNRLNTEQVTPTPKRGLIANRLDTMTHDKEGIEAYGY